MFGGALRASILYLLASNFAEHQSGATLVTLFAVGAVQDLVVALVLGNALLLAGVAGRNILKSTLVLLLAVVLIVGAAELFFWHEFESRLDRLVFHYLAYPQEVAYFLEEQFALTWLALPFLGIVWLCFLPFKPRLLPPTGYPGIAGKDWVAISISIVFGLYVLFDSPQWRIGNSRTVNELASNGYLGVLRAAQIDASSWQGQYWQPANQGSAQSDAPQAAIDGGTAAAEKEAIRHVVLIIEESLSGPTWQNPELAQHYLPVISALQTKSLNFTNVYATGSRTSRGQEALLNGYPPLPGVAVSQRKGHAMLPSLPRALSANGYYTKFVYAGWPDFSGFQTYWNNIGFDSSTNRFDFIEAAANGAFETSWGYADETLFDRILSELDTLTRQHNRVFVAALTVSNHRPYDYPPGRIPFPAEERRADFAMAYADWALGAFLEQASTKPWFAETLFVIAADHGAKFYGEAPIPVTSYRVPLLFYAPELLKPQEVNTLGSIMSFPTTLLALLDADHSEKFYGVDLLSNPTPLVPVEHNYDVGLISEAQLTVLHRGGNISGWKPSPSVAGGAYVELPADLANATRAAALFGDAHRQFYESTTK